MSSEGRLLCLWVALHRGPVLLKVCVPLLWSYALRSLRGRGSGRPEPGIVMCDKTEQITSHSMPLRYLVYGELAWKYSQRWEWEFNPHAAQRWPTSTLQHRKTSRAPSIPPSSTRPCIQNPWKNPTLMYCPCTMPLPTDPPPQLGSASVPATSAQPTLAVHSPTTRRTPWTSAFLSMPPTPNPGTAQQVAYLKAGATSAGPLLWPWRTQRWHRLMLLSGQTLAFRRRCLRLRATLRWRGRVGHRLQIPWVAPKVCTPHCLIDPFGEHGQLWTPTGKHAAAATAKVVRLHAGGLLPSLSVCLLP